MWSFAHKKQFRMSGFDKVVDFKDVFSKEPRYEDYKTVKPKLYQSVRKTKKGRKKYGNSQNRKAK